MPKRLFLLIMWISLLPALYSQVSFNIGYHAGNTGKGANSLRNEIYYLKHFKYPSLENSFHVPGIVHGVDIELMLGSLEPKSFYVFWNWSNSHLTAKSSGTDPLTSQPMDIAFKYRHNNLNIIGFGFKVNSWLGIVYSPVDIGNLKLLYKNSLDEKASSYTDYFNVEKGLLSDYTIYGSTYGLDFFLKNRLRGRLSYFMSWDGVDFRDQDDILTTHYFNANRLTFSLALMLRKND